MAYSILIIGCGDLGRALAHRVVMEGHHVTGVRRGSGPLPAGVASLQADVTAPASLHALAAMNPDVLVYSVAAAEQSDASYRMHYVEGLRNTLAALQGRRLQHVFFVSSTRVYGQTADALLDESAEAIPADFGGRRLLEAESLLEEAACPSTVLRLSGIYGPGRHRLIALARSPAHWPVQNTWTNRIHRDDAAAFIAWLIRGLAQGQAIAPRYLVTDGHPAPQHEVLRWLAEQQGVHVDGPLPSVREGKRLDNAAMRATGFQLRYPDYRSGYAHELAVQPLA